MIQEAIYSTKGEKGLLSMEKTAFLCSRNAPSWTVESMVGWAVGVEPGEMSVVMGSRNTMERRVFNLLLENFANVILFTEEPLEWIDISPLMERALEEGRLLILSIYDGKTVFTPHDCNGLIVNLAKKVVVGYCRRGGHLEKMIKGLSDVERLDSFNPEEVQYGENASQKEKASAIRQKYNRNFTPWTSHDDLRLEHLYREGKSLDRLAEIFHRSRGGIYLRLSKLGLLPKLFE